MERLGVTTGRTALNLIAVVALALLLVVVPAPRPASAHGLLVSSEPANGATLKSPVETVSLAFTEKPSPFAFFSVSAPSGLRLDGQWSNAEPFRLEKPVTEYQEVDGQWQPREFHAGFPVRVPVAYWPENGTYLVRYHNVASDGDSVKGEVRFTYDGAVTVAPPGWQAPTSEPSAELLAAAKEHGGSSAAVAEAAAPVSDDRGPWPWLVPVLLVVAVAGAAALALTGPSGKALRKRLSRH